MFNRFRFALALGLTCLSLGWASAQESEGRVFVLVVGVEDYSDPKITDLRYAEDDAQAVYDFFAKDLLSPTVAERVKLLRGKAATQRGVRLAIRDHLIRQATGPKDTAIFYFAGHGFADAYGVYLGTVDTKLTELELSGLAWSDLQRDWSRISAGRRVFIADACHSGALEGLRGPGGIGKRVLAIQPKGGSVSVTVAATGANQLSSEDTKSGHGVFTASLLAGLRGKADGDRDGAVSLGELAGHLKQDVPRRAKAAGGNQVPEIHYAGDAELGRQLQLSGGAAGSLKPSGSERRALEAEIENAELRLKLARLKGKLAEAEAAAKEAEAARARLAGLDSESSTPSGLDAKAVQVRLTPFRVGEVHLERGQLELKMALADKKGEKQSQVVTRDYERTFRIEELKEGRPKVLGTRYAKMRQVVEVNGRARRNGPEIENKSFHTRGRVGRLKHADDAYERVRDDFVQEELDTATRHLMSTWPDLASAIARTKLEPGKEIAFGGIAIQPLLEFPNDEGIVTRVVQFSYQGTRDQEGVQVAVFKVELLLGPAKADGMPIEMKLRGELAVFVQNGRLALIRLTGPIALGASDDREALSGSGTIRLERTVKVTQPK